MTDTEPHATLPAGTALLAEVIYASTNLIDDTASFHLVFEADAVGSNPTPAAVTTALITRLNFPQGSASFAITAWLAPSVDRGSSSSKINIYDISAHLDGTPHGSPIYTAAWDPAAMHPTSVQPVPDGVAGVISYRSDYGTDPEFGPPGSGTKPGARARPRATHRNRIYM